MCNVLICEFKHFHIVFKYLFFQNDLEKVIEDCTAALNLNKRYIKAMIRRAKAAEKLNNLDLALEDLATTCLLEGFQNHTNISELDRIAKATGL